MEKLREKEARKLNAIAGLAELFGRAMSEPGLRMYLAAIADIPADAVEHAAAIAATRCKFMPAPVELREQAGITGLSQDEEALIAWETVARAANDVGSYKTVDFGDRTINAVVRTLGGWPELLARSPEEFDKWLRKDFISTYKTYSKCRLSEEAYAPCGGLSQGGLIRQIDGTYVEYSPKIARIDRSTAPAIGYRDRESEKIEYANVECSPYNPR